METKECPVCYSDYTREQSITLPCQCSHCPDCLTQWTATNIAELAFQQSHSVPCMSESCKKLFNPVQILPQFSSKSQAKINDALF
mmetsp:Transcript_7482/g.6807  ORF Transcript_7482/g.6807 Transcript_7482/m.6807 type:complete len:85 (+) Transcript_7482:41-295(+)